MPAQPERNYVRLQCAAGNLLLPQEQVRGVAPALDARVGNGGVGEVILSGSRWPLYVLDEALMPSARDTEFRFCVCLHDDDIAIALAAAAFDILPSDDLQVLPLPDCMRNARLPFHAMARIADDAGLFLSVNALHRHLRTLVQ